MARPTKLTREIHEKIVTLVRAGNYRETAAAATGISPVTLREWLRRGARGGGGIYRAFAEDVDRAEAESEARDILEITKAGKKDWKALAWRLERRFPKRWGEMAAIDGAGDGNRDVTVTIVEFPSASNEDSPGANPGGGAPSDSAD